LDDPGRAIRYRLEEGHQSRDPPARARLFGILEAVERIGVQAVRGRAAFADNELDQTAVIGWVEVG
jgi:hypothetical protein